jgi:DNA (cytosine-5)-methyltransferase 1
MKVFSLFSGIGGFECALEKHGADCVGFCEIDGAAQSVLRHRFPGVRIHNDILELKALPKIDILTAGFPCQDLSQAGPKVGITGARSSLVDHVFRLLESSKNPPSFVLLENVSYMLRLHQGASVRYVIDRAERLGFNWAYRVMDARSFGTPQRRERIIFLLSRRENPAEILFPTGIVDSGVDDSVGQQIDKKCLYGFYWTEGKRGLGWAKNSVPTIKGGSTIGIPSPPAIWDPKSGLFGTPSLNDAERLFGFPVGWTDAAENYSTKAGTRWKLLGNSLSVPMVDWVAQQMFRPQGLGAESRPLQENERFPSAAYGSRGVRRVVDASVWVQKAPQPNLRKFLSEPLKPLSLRAASGFYKRAKESTVIRFSEGFLESLATYIQSHPDV